jgi:putative DNA methylase
LIGPQRRNLDDLDEPRDIIDVLHIWEEGKHPEIVRALGERGCRRSESFHRIAQAISETLPNESKERKLLAVLERAFRGEI